MATVVKKNISVIPAMPAYDRTVRPQMKASGSGLLSCQHANGTAGKQL